MSDEEDGPVWHYTTTAGLIGMLTTHEIWATSCSFLNDPGEDSFAEEAIGLALHDLTPGWDEGIAAYEDGLKPSSDPLVFSRRFVVCASAKADSLELWRGYGSRAMPGTFAVELDPSGPLGPVVKSDEFKSSKQWEIVEYLEPENTADRAMRSITTSRRMSDRFYGDFAHDPTPTDRERTLEILALARDEFAAVCKHKAYEAEAERRITIDLEESENRTAYFLRPGPHGPIAYIPLRSVDRWNIRAEMGEGVDKRRRLPIKSIITSPNAPRTALQGVVAALERGGYRARHPTDGSFHDGGDDGLVAIRTSTVPFV